MPSLSPFARCLQSLTGHTTLRPAFKQCSKCLCSCENTANPEGDDESDVVDAVDDQTKEGEVLEQQQQQPPPPPPRMSLLATLTGHTSLLSAVKKILSPADKIDPGNDGMESLEESSKITRIRSASKVVGVVANGVGGIVTQAVHVVTSPRKRNFFPPPPRTLTPQEINRRQWKRIQRFGR